MLGSGLTLRNSRVTFLFMKRQIQFYETEGGTRVINKFIRSLDKQTQAKVVAAIGLVGEDEELPAHLFCKMVNTAGLWEIRVKHNKNIYRLLSFFDGAKLIIVAHGFQKKTQKTPKKEIPTAERRKKDYLRRKNANL